MKKQNLVEQDGEAWWIDYMEEELEPSVLKDMDWLVRFSKTDQEIVDNFKELKAKIKTCDWSRVDFGEDYWSHLNQRIMTAIEQEVDSTQAQVDEESLCALREPRP